ncbi:MAG: [FeFe] hydrogenase H-cluster radical SAM maturase HydE [Pirellulaceae bacterium]
MALTFDEILGWLKETDSRRLDWLWKSADQVRREHVGDGVHLRGLLEISNFCDRSCLYCGIRQPNAGLPRYRMTWDEIRAGAGEAVRRGYGTVVLQSGEDPALDVARLCEVIREIKSPSGHHAKISTGTNANAKTDANTETPLAVTLSLGERPEGELQALRDAGADRYLLRFETSNRDLLQAIHPPRAGEAAGHRLSLLSVLRRQGFEVGSGVMVGIPGQSWADLARDVLLFKQLDLDMIGIGPYIPHPDTPLFERARRAGQCGGDQALADEVTTYKMLALARLACPRANIPSTTALATINPSIGQMLGLQRGANVLMPNVTPRKYRSQYAIYPHKSGSQRTPEQSDEVAREQIAALGRYVAIGRGDSPNHLLRRPLAALGSVE